MAGVLTTAYLGKVTFYEEPTLREICREVFSMSHRIVWTQVILRGVALVIFLVWTIPREDNITPNEGFLPFVVFGLFLLRSLRPYINEIVVLERSPIWSRSANQITIGKRSSRLHGPNSGDLFGRGIAMIPVIAVLGYAVLGLLWFIVSTYTNYWGFSEALVHVAIPGTFWILGLYATIFRFLSYLDLRIRREGWEVELKMRAEANRMNERVAVAKA